MGEGRGGHQVQLHGGAARHRQARLHPPRQEHHQRGRPDRHRHQGDHVRDREALLENSSSTSSLLFIQSRNRYLSIYLFDYLFELK